MKHNVVSSPLSQADSSSDLPIGQTILPKKRKLPTFESDSDDSSSDEPLISLQKALKKRVDTNRNPFRKLLVSSSDTSDDDQPLKAVFQRNKNGVKRRRRLSKSGGPASVKRRKPNRRASMTIAERMNPPQNYETRKHTIFESKKGSVKWWEIPPYKGLQQWTTFDHNGVIFPDLYEPHGIKMKYDGKELELTPDQEEVATWFADILESDHAQNPTFCKNFFAEWRQILTGPRQIRKFPFVKEFNKCDFTPILKYRQEQKEKVKELRKDPDYKAAQKKKKEDHDKMYGYCLVDGSLDKVGNVRVEPPGLFRGRGKHPKTGMIKKRLMPENIVLNIGEGITIPECPVAGHNWGGIIHDNTVTYIAKWIENINGNHKMIYLHSSSRFKGQSDKDKFEKARKLKKYIQKIRLDYTRMLQSNTRGSRQLATAVWMIDILSIRVGNEKDTEEAADTVGVCSLRVEHVKLFPETYEVELDFLGKDSMRYYNKIKFPELVFANMKLFVKKKAPTHQLFDQIDPGSVNQYLNKLMDGLSAKVFRTYNASITLQKELDKAFDGSKIADLGSLDKDSTVDQKKFFYDKANTRVAILCNHQKSVSKGHTEQMEKLETRLTEAKKQLARYEKELVWAKKGKAPTKEKWKKKSVEQVASSITKLRARINKYELAIKLKGDNKEVALGTSKINYMDPRITVAFCKKLEVPLEKIFNKSLVDKFPWACAVKPEYRF